MKIEEESSKVQKLKNSIATIYNSLIQYNFLNWMKTTGMAPLNAQPMIGHQQQVILHGEDLKKPLVEIN